jgi:hypothetical protein
LSGVALDLTESHFLFRVATGVLLFLAVILPGCGGTASGSDANAESATSAAPFVGCYELKLGRWWPWAFGEDTPYVTPPAHIELRPERGAEGFEKDNFLVRTIHSGSPSRGGPSYWLPTADDNLDVTWNDGFTGVTLKLAKRGGELVGWAHPHFDSFHFIPRIARVTGRKVACDASQ